MEENTNTKISETNQGKEQNINYFSFKNIYNSKVHRNEIKKNLIPLSIKSKRIFNEVSQDMGFICPEYKVIKFKIKRNINKQLPPDLIKFDEIPDEPKYYKIFIIRTNKYSNNTLITPKNFHCDFEKGIFDVTEKLFPNINIRYLSNLHDFSLWVKRYSEDYSDSIGSFFAYGELRAPAPY
ncbi:hypothetical protein U3516DRAFT_744472 [Neocallimastix sp. 'constans']